MSKIIQIESTKAVRAEGYSVSQKPADGPTVVTISKDFRQKQGFTEGMNWKTGDAVKELYAEDIEIDGERYDVVIIARLRREAIEREAAQKTAAAKASQ